MIICTSKKNRAVNQSICTMIFNLSGQPDIFLGSETLINIRLHRPNSFSRSGPYFFYLQFANKLFRNLRTAIELSVGERKASRKNNALPTHLLCTLHISYSDLFKVYRMLRLNWFLIATDYGCPMKPFFIEIQNFWAWADKLGR